MSEVCPEISFAAKWWAEVLNSSPFYQSGDSWQDILLSFIPWSKAPRRELDLFRTKLESTMKEKFCSSWDSKRPRFGGALRVVGVDYEPDLLLSEAGLAAGIDISLRLPVKTVMWVNPGEVRVAIGYRAPIKVVYNCNPSPAVEKANSK